MDVEEQACPSWILTRVHVCTPTGRGETLRETGLDMTAPTPAGWPDPRHHRPPTGRIACQQAASGTMWRCGGLLRMKGPRTPGRLGLGSRGPPAWDLGPGRDRPAGRPAGQPTHHVVGLGLYLGMAGLLSLGARRPPHRKTPMEF